MGFDRVVGVTGTPQLGLHIGGRTRPAAYVSGAGTEVLSFRYVVQAADRDADGIHIPANALTWNGGSIRAGGVDAVRTHAAVAVDPSRKVDGGVSASVTLRPARLDVPEGRTGRYSIVLDMEPAGAVTVSIASDHDEVVPTPGALTFATGTWATAQTVTVAAAEDGDAQDDGATLGHTVGGFGAGTVRAAALRVTVEDDDEQIVVVPGTTTQETVGSRTLTVIAEAAAPAGVRITKPETLAADVTVTVAPPAAAQPVSGGQFRLGQEADDRTVVDITVTAVPPGGLEVCLPVTAALRREAGGAALLLLHYDGSRWTVVAESRDLGTRVCAPGVTDFSPFAVGYVRRAVVPVNSTPRFPDAAAVDLPIFTQGTAIAPVTLPGATGGVGALTYTLTGPDGADLPPGLSYTHPTAEDAHGGTLSGTPTEAQEPTPYMLTATDRNGDSVDLEFSLEVTEDVMPMFRDDAAVADQDYVIEVAIPPLRFPPVEAGNAPLTYTLVGPEGADLPAGLHYTPPEAEDAHGGTLSGTPTEARPPIPYTLTATDMDGDSVTLEFTVAIILVKARVTIADATAVEGAPVTFQVTLSRALAAPLTVQWTAGVPGTATPGDDYEAVVGRLVIDAGETAGALSVQTADDRRVEPSETFTVGIALSEETVAEVAKVTATGTIEDDDTARARRRSLGMVLAGVGRTLATDAVDVIGSRFVRRPTSRQVTVGGQALGLDRDAQTGRWRQSVGVAYGVARALGVEVGSPLAGGDSRFGQIRGAAWSSLTRHLNDPHAAAAPPSAWDTPGAFAAPVGMGLDGPSDAHSIPPPAGRRPGGRAPRVGKPGRQHPV